MKPVIREIDLGGRTPLQMFEGAPASWKRLAFLASDGTVDSRWSIIAWDPVKNENPETVEISTELPFVGGSIGTIDYEGSAEFSYYDRALVYDHHERRWWGVNMVEPGVDFVETHCNASLRGNIQLTPSWDFPQYQRAFNIVHDHIRRGEIYQACLTFPFVGKPVPDTRALFVELLKKNPAPMAAYLEQSERTVMSLSPERFISWDGTILETRPIKGTRPRAEMKEEDEGMRKELLGDEKEQAELTMITDLLRNDLAKISKPGTVKVVEERGVQKTPDVWHTYSRIQSATRDGVLAWDIIESMFPGGSISGCPKIRAMEILKEVETAPRGIYTGCIGYISDHGRMDLSIAIRTLEQSPEDLKAGFGSGLVFDSVAEKEYAECFAKAKTFLS